MVTGAASGIGWALSRRLAEPGAQVVLMDVNRDPRESRKADLRSAGRPAEGSVVDVTSDLPEALRRTAAGNRRPDCVFNNANVGATFVAPGSRRRRLGATDGTRPRQCHRRHRTAYELMRSRGRGISSTPPRSRASSRSRPGPLRHRQVRDRRAQHHAPTEAATDGVEVSVVGPGAVATPIWGTPIRGDGSDVAATHGVDRAAEAAAEILDGVLRDRASAKGPRKIEVKHESRASG